ncbi:uncharacterized protein LOC111254559 isoform X2 [Varroa destructor]|uniref:Uncharacterized protein n=1 Tax=Varroa destructor TaxID=109461 RepID=A0A7M7KSA9_VARDE|nr:uncharacterized protein LOC111254559 isoform X2 [Varroa destructor]
MARQAYPKVLMEKHPFVTSIQIESDKLIIKGLPLHNGKTTLQLKTYFSNHLKSNRRIDLIPEDLDETDSYCRLIPSVGIDFADREVLDRAEIIQFIEKLSEQLKYPSNWIKATTKTFNGKNQHLISGLRISLMHPGPCDGNAVKSDEKVREVLELYRSGKLQSLAPAGHRIGAVNRLDEVSRSGQQRAGILSSSAMHKPKNKSIPVSINIGLINGTSTESSSNWWESASTALHFISTARTATPASFTTTKLPAASTMTETSSVTTKNESSSDTITFTTTLAAMTPNIGTTIIAQSEMMATAATTPLAIDSWQVSTTAKLTQNEDMRIESYTRNPNLRLITSTTESNEENDVDGRVDAIASTAGDSVPDEQEQIAPLKAYALPIAATFTVLIFGVVLGLVCMVKRKILSNDYDLHGGEEGRLGGIVA